MQTIAKQLKAAREGTGLSQEDIAKQLRMSSVNYGDFERGKLLPSINYLTELSHILSKPLTYFLEIHTDHDLSQDEVELLEVYRGLSVRGKKSILGIAKHLLDQEKQNGT